MPKANDEPLYRHAPGFQQLPKLSQRLLSAVRSYGRRRGEWPTTREVARKLGVGADELRLALIETGADIILLRNERVGLTLKGMVLDPNFSAAHALTEAFIHVLESKAVAERGWWSPECIRAEFAHRADANRVNEPAAARSSDPEADLRLFFLILRSGEVGAPRASSEQPFFVSPGWTWWPAVDAQLPSAHLVATTFPLARTRLGLTARQLLEVGTSIKAQLSAFGTVDRRRCAWFVDELPHVLRNACEEHADPCWDLVRRWFDWVWRPQSTPTFSAAGVEELLGGIRRATGRRLPSANEWCDVTMTIGDGEFALTIAGKTVWFPGAPGVLSKRKDSRLWQLLETLGEKRGRIPEGHRYLSREYRDRTKQFVHRLNKKLRGLVPDASGNPIVYVRRKERVPAEGYRAHFHLRRRQEDG